MADDGSSDGTSDYVQAIAATEPRVRLVRRARNGGKGRAVLDAIEAANGRYVLIADADGATPIHELAALRDAVVRRRRDRDRLARRTARRSRAGAQPAARRASARCSTAW